MDFPHGEVVTRLRGVATLDPYSGEPTGVDWSTPDEAVIGPCAFNPGGSQELTQDGRVAIVTRPELYAPTGSDVLAGDRLVVRGKTYEVDGDPEDWRSPFTGWAPGLVIKLERVEG